MSFFRDRQVRRYLLFLIIFSVSLLVFSALYSYHQSLTGRNLLLAHSNAVAASLLEQGVSPEVAATALTSAGESAEGRRLLEMTGLTERTSLSLFPFINKQYPRSMALALLSASLLAALCLGCSLFFLAGRERLYQKAAGILDQYADGNFTQHLPRGEESALYQLFASVEQLATALQSKNESVAMSREFMKDTISDISHQLKTPLAALHMYQEIISEEPDHPETVAAFSGKTEQALKRMDNLIQALLKITRLDAGSITFDKKSYTVQELLRHATQELTTRAAVEGKELLLEGDPGESIFCDLQWTNEAIANLIKNALDHTLSGGHIRVSWERTPIMLRISVRDDGSGIAPEDIHHIFKRFYRSRNSLDTQGTGLGLSLSKSIVEGQGGLINVKSSPEGTVFTASFLTES